MWLNLSSKWTTQPLELLWPIKPRQLDCGWCDKRCVQPGRWRGLKWQLSEIKSRKTSGDGASTSGSKAHFIAGGRDNLEHVPFISSTDRCFWQTSVERSLKFYFFAKWKSRETGKSHSDINCWIQSTFHTFVPDCILYPFTRWHLTQMHVKYWYLTFWIDFAICKLNNAFLKKGKPSFFQILWPIKKMPFAGLSGFSKEERRRPKRTRCAHVKGICHAKQNWDICHKSSSQGLCIGFIHF